MKYIKSQIQEIESYKSLRWYGAFLSLTHIATFFFWHHNAFVYQYLTRNANAICWPQLPFCESLRFLSPMGVQVLLYVYLVVAIFTVFLFLNKKTLIYAYGLFLTVNVLKLYMFLMDYRLMDGSHYILFLVSFVYLFIRKKLVFIPLLISCFYFFTALLKISDPVWLMGLGFKQDIWLPSFFTENMRLVFYFYIVCLEMIGSLFLVLRTHWKALVYMQWILLYIISCFTVGYFYPAVMLCLLSVFWLMLVFNENYKISGFNRMFSGVVFTLLVVVGSLLSFIIPGDANLTGEGRLYGLNVPSAYTHCNSQIILSFQNKTLQEHFPRYYEGYPLNLRCDPYMDFNTIKQICAFYKDDPEFIDLNWSLYSKRGYDLEYRQIVKEENVCSKNLKYFSWRRNHWIKKRK